MDLRIFLSTFATVFLAELGDKTQLATFTLAVGSDRRLSIFLGSALALAASSLLAVTVADRVARVVPVRWMHAVAGVALVVFGVVYLVDAWRNT